MKDLWSLFQAWSYSRLFHSRLGRSWLGRILRDVVPGLVVPGLVVLGLVIPGSVGVQQIRLKPWEGLILSPQARINL
jgi:hypothetical protein